ARGMVYDQHLVGGLLHGVNRSIAHVLDAHIRVTGDINHHGGAVHGASVIVDRHHAVGRLRVRENRRIRDDDRAKGIAAATANHINEQYEPQPEKPLHSNSMENISLTWNSLLYREPGREGK